MSKSVDEIMNENFKEVGLDIENIKNDSNDDLNQTIISELDNIEKQENYNEEFTFAEIVEANLPNVNSKKIAEDIAKIGENLKFDHESRIVKETIGNFTPETVIADDDEIFEKIIDDVTEFDNESIVDGLKTVKEKDKTMENVELNLKDIEFVEDTEKPLTDEDGIDLNSFEDIYSNKKISKFRVNKKKIPFLAKRGIAIIAAIGVITGSVLVLRSCGKKNKTTATEQPTTTVSTIESTTSIPTTNDELDVEVEVNTKPIPTQKGEISNKDVFIDSNGTAWESKDDASKAPENGNKEVKVESGYLAPDGNVYESKEDYNKLKNTEKATKQTEKKLYYATDGTAFESEKDRDAWNKALKQQNSTTKKLYYATDGTAFESEKDRDAYNAAIKTQNSTTKKYYTANDGTLFETKEDMETWNKALKQQKTITIQQTSYNSKAVSIQEEISLLKQYKDALIASNLTYEESTIKTLSL